MRKIAFLTFLLLTTFVLHSQNLKKITIEECNRSEISENYCADYEKGKYDNAIIVFNTNLPDLKFGIVNAKNNLIFQKHEPEKNRYILCVEPMGELYNEYKVEISGKDIITTTVIIAVLKPRDKRFYCINEVSNVVSNEKPPNLPPIVMIRLTVWATMDIIGAVQLKTVREHLVCSSVAAMLT